MLRISSTLTIPDEELVERFVRAAGPGGQNVNKVATAVELRFNVLRSSVLPEPLRLRLLARRDRRLSDAGILVIQARRFRTRERNREDARERLAALLRAASKVPRKRIATRPGRAAKERRLSGKRERAELKRRRDARSWEGD